MHEQDTDKDKVELLKMSLGEVYEPNKARIHSSLIDIVRTNRSKWLYIDNCHLYTK